MKRVITLLLTICAASLIYCQHPNRDINPTAEVSKPYHLFIGGSWYHDRDQANGNDASANPIGLILGFERCQRNDVYVYLRGFWGMGRFEGDRQHSFMHRWYANGRVGYMIGFGENDEFGLAPYVGLGYQQDIRSIHEPSNSKQRLKKWYLPAGLYFDWKVNEKFNVGANGQIIWAFNRKNTVLSGTNEEDRVSYREHFNLLGELHFAYTMIENQNYACDLSLVPFYSFEKMTPRTTTTAFGSSPLSEHCLGARLELGYWF